jgi:putative DNA primase/helicase
MDESQSLSRRGSEASEVMREILNAGIGKNAKVVRCGGQRMDEIQEFSVYGPTVFAMIGEPDSVLADRCLPVALRRKTKQDQVQRYRSREVEEIGAEVKAELEQWARENVEKVKEAYDRLEPFAIENDRMADLLMPLQAVVSVADLDGSDGLAGILRKYAESLDVRDQEADRQDPGVRLLVACQEIFTETAKALGCPSVLGVFLSTEFLLRALVGRIEEPWATYTRGVPITAEALAKLLREYGIRSERNRDQSARGYVAARFKDAWDRYLACPSKKPPSPPNPDTTANGKEDE